MSIQQFVIKIFGWLDINVEDIDLPASTAESSQARSEIYILNIYIQPSENLYYKMLNAYCGMLIRKDVFQVVSYEPSINLFHWESSGGLVLMQNFDPHPALRASLSQWERE